MPLYAPVDRYFQPPSAISTTMSARSFALTACAGRASSVAPLSISSSEYSNVNCDEARAQLETSRQKENALTRKQNNAAVADAAGVFLFLVPLGSVFGQDVAGELAQAKGESLALQRRVGSACSAPAA